MDKAHIQKRISYMTNKINHHIDNYDILYSKQYKLDRNRIKRVNSQLNRYKKMLDYYINQFIDLSE
jgi:hypothetical protein